MTGDFPAKKKKIKMPFPSQRHYLERLALNSWFIEFINMAADFPAKNHTHTQKDQNTIPKPETGRLAGK